MITLRHLLASLISIVALSYSTLAAANEHDAFSKLLARYVSADSDGVHRVDYASWAVSEEDSNKLDNYIAELASQDLFAIADRDAQFASWVNLYNALTIELILENYPVTSIRKIKSGLFSTGPWRREVVTIAGRAMSLDDIEHGVLRKSWDESRVHYAVNCASIGCPNLAPIAWEAARLEADLDAAARSYVNHPRGAFISEDGKLTVSSIYKWFDEDFGGDHAGVIAHLKIYAAPELSARLETISRISDYRYDWSLNEKAQGEAK